MKFTNNPICIYHGACDDGFAAAWCVRQKYPAAEFYPGVYGKEPPDVTGRDVIMVDFSYKRPMLEAMLAKANRFLILDHHKTAAEDLDGLGQLYPRAKIQFDMFRSGAVMAWDWFNPNIFRPDFIRYIQDRDLWLKKLPNGDEFTIALRSYPQDFDVWTDLVRAGPEALIAEGHAIQRYYRRRVEELKKSAYIAHLGGSLCRISNAPYFAASEVAGEIIDSSVQFGACYFESEMGKFQYSLRSRDDFDVSEIAKKFGGGGHKNAAGFTTIRLVHEGL